MTNFHTAGGRHANAPGSATVILSLFPLFVKFESHSVFACLWIILIALLTEKESARMTVQSTMKFLLKNHSSDQKILPITRVTAALRHVAAPSRSLGTYPWTVFSTMQYSPKTISPKMTLTFLRPMVIIQQASSVGTIVNVTRQNQSVAWKSRTPSLSYTRYDDVDTDCEEYMQNSSDDVLQTSHLDMPKTAVRFSPRLDDRKILSRRIPIFPIENERIYCVVDIDRYKLHPNDLAEEDRLSPVYWDRDKLFKPIVCHFKN